MHPQSARPGFVRPAPALVVFEKCQVGHRVGSNKFVLPWSKLRLLMHASPGTRVEIILVEHIAVGVTRIEGYCLGMMRMPIDDMLCPAIAKVLFSKCVLRVGGGSSTPKLRNPLRNPAGPSYRQASAEF